MQYIKQHWHGKLPFFKAFLLNFLVPLCLLNLFLSPFVVWVFAQPVSSKMVTNAAIAIAFSVVFVWQCTGLLRTAESKTRETGERLWSTIAYISIVLAIMFVIATCIGVFQQITALREEQNATETSFVRTYKIEVDGNSGFATVSGILDPGVTRELREILLVEKDVHTLRLHSDGGQIYEGRGLHALAKKRQLDTLIEGRCLSACAMAFLGGVKRRIAEGGVLGFHQYKTYSIQPNINVAEEQQRDAELMLSQGVSADFVQQVFTASPHQMWLPVMAELSAAGVIHSAQPVSESNN